MTSSGTYSFNPAIADVLLEAFDRCGIRGSSLSREHIISGRRSINFELQSWGNRVPLLWTVDLQSINLEQGISTYPLPTNTVAILDAYRETYSLPTTVTQAPDFNTIIGQSNVTVNQTAHGLVINDWVNFLIQVSVGGILLYGQYQVNSVIGPDQYTIGTNSVATSTVANGGSVPSFTTTLSSPIITVILNNHGYSVGNGFNVYADTFVGGVELTGVYVIISVTDANTFTFSQSINASSAQTVSENSGDVTFTTQYQGQDPIDQFMMPISRSEYAMYPDKVIQGPPTVYWFDRLSPTPTVTVWQTPDGNGPYAFKFYRMRQIQDASPTNGQTADVPYLFLDALCSGVATRLARKFAPAMVKDLMVESGLAWKLAIEENVERTPIMIVPDLSQYWTI